MVHSASLRTQPGSANIAAHLQGPWWVEESGSSFTVKADHPRAYAAGVNGKPRLVATFHKPHPDAFANALLSSAGPEMLSALLEVRDCLMRCRSEGLPDACDQWVQHALGVTGAAILKATTANSVGMEPMQSAECTQKDQPQ